MRMANIYPYPYKTHYNISYIKRRLGIIVLIIVMSISMTKGQEAENETKATENIKKTLESDKQALLKIRDTLSINNTNSNLALAWTEDTDPCIDEWSYILCDCSNSDETLNPKIYEYCVDAELGDFDDDVYRVVVLNLPGERSPEEKYKGTLSSAFGELTQLSYLDLSNNEINGTIPDSFANLTKLSYLSLAQNQLSGDLPEYFQNYNQLKNLELEINMFSGPVPQAWCEGPSPWNATLLLNNNIGLCGDLPTCLEEFVQPLAETWIKSDNTDSKNLSGECDDTAPICGECKVIVPEFWSETDHIDFNYVNVEDPQSDISGYFLSIVSTTNLSRSIIEPIKLDTTNSWTNTNGTYNEVMFNISTLDVQLVAGNEYHINLTAINKAGPPLNTTFSTTYPVMYDNSPPAEVELVYNTPNLKNEEEQKQGSTFGVSWSDIFVDVESGMDYINVSINEKIEGNEEKEYMELEYKLIGVDGTSVTFPNITLKDGATYIYIITAFNKAGLNVTLETDKFMLETIEEPIDRTFISNGSSLTFILILIFGFIIGGCTVSALVLFIRKKKRKCKQKRSFDSKKFILDFMKEILEYNSMDENGNNVRSPSPPLSSSQPLFTFGQGITFVVTDIKDSTAQSTIDDKAFRYVIEIHNKIIEEALEQYGGYEILTEGDSYQLAFNSVSNAILCAMEIQYNMLEFKWPQEVLRMPGCKAEKFEFGGYSFKGPRVRIGIHYAFNSSLSFNSRIHQETQRPIFEGPGIEIAKEIGNAAEGGQVLLTGSTWQHVDLKQAGYPVIKEIGIFKIDNSFENMWLYEIVQLAGRPLNRVFDLPRCIHHIGEGRDLYVINAPDPETIRSRSNSESKMPSLNKLSNQQAAVDDAFNVINSGRVTPPMNSSFKRIITFVATKIDMPRKNMTYELNKFVHEMMAMQAQYVKGYVARNDIKTGLMLLSFANPTDALCFAYLCQLNLVLYNWSEKVLYQYEQVVSGDVMEPPIFKGPRVAIAIHTTKRFRIIEIANSNKPDIQKVKSVRYEGQGERFVRHLCMILNGGQVVFSDRAWSKINKPLPGGAIVMDLGKHIVHPMFNRPVLLKQVLPKFFEARKFDRIRSNQQVEPGYLDAPSDEKDMAIVFIKPQKPKVIQLIENQSGNVPSMDGVSIRSLLYNYNMALYMFSSLIRKRLIVYDGYECKEPEPGKFTLAFTSFKNAILWACHIQIELMDLDWPENLLRLTECKEIHDVRTNRIISRGLRARIGVAHGRDCHKIRLASGRADYIGFVPNLAAKIMNQADPGEVLVRAVDGYNSADVLWIKEDVGIINYTEDLSKEIDGIDEVAVELVCYGDILLRQIEEPQTIYSARGSSLSNEDVDLCSRTHKTAMPTTFHKRLSVRNIFKYFKHIVINCKFNYMSPPSGFTSTIYTSSQIGNSTTPMINSFHNQSLSFNLNPESSTRSLSYQTSTRLDPNLPSYLGLDVLPSAPTHRRPFSFSGRTHFGSISSLTSGHASSYAPGRTGSQDTISLNSLDTDSHDTKHSDTSGPEITENTVPDVLTISVGDGFIPGCSNNNNNKNNDDDNNDETRVEINCDSSDDDEESNKKKFAHQRTFPFLSGRASFSFNQLSRMKQSRSAEINWKNK